MLTKNISRVLHKTVSVGSRAWPRTRASAEEGKDDREGFLCKTVQKKHGEKGMEKATG